MKARLGTVLEFAAPGTCNNDRNVSACAHNRIWITPAARNGRDYTFQDYVVHEFGHIWHQKVPGHFTGFNQATMGIPGPTQYSREGGAEENFAESFMVYMAYGQNARLRNVDLSPQAIDYFSALNLAW